MALLTDGVTDESACRWCLLALLKVSRGLRAFSTGPKGLGLLGALNFAKPEHVAENVLP